TVELSPNGLPTANTRSPTCNLSYSAHFKAGRFFASILTTARSVFGSVPTTFALNSRRSLSVTVICVAPSTTWLLVTIYPFGSTMTPDPALGSGRPCPRPGGIGGGVGSSPPGGSSPGGPSKGPGGNGDLRPRGPLFSPPVTAILTTAGVTCLTISEKPC